MAEYVDVTDVVEAQYNATFEIDGQPCYIRGPSADRPGDIFHKDSVIARSHPELMAPLRLPLGVASERTAGQLNSAWRGEPPDPGTITEKLNSGWRLADSIRARGGQG